MPIREVQLPANADPMSSRQQRPSPRPRLLLLLLLLQLLLLLRYLSILRLPVQQAASPHNAKARSMRLIFAAVADVAPHHQLLSRHKSIPSCM